MADESPDLEHSPDDHGSEMSFENSEHFDEDDDMSESSDSINDDDDNDEDYEDVDEDCEDDGVSDLESDIDESDVDKSDIDKFNIDEFNIDESDNNGFDDDEATSIKQLQKVELEIQRVEATIADGMLYDGNLMPPEHYRQDILDLDPEVFNKKYSPGTINGMNNSEYAWIRFCDKILQTSDWKAQYLRITIQILYNFLRWHLNQTTGKGGRQKKRTSKGKSLVTFWCMFRLAFQRAHGFKINKVVDCDKITNAIANLQNDHALDHNTRENRSMTLQDLKDQIEATLKTTEKSFKLGELRILAVLFLLLLAPQGARPHSILKLRFGDLQLFLVRDPTDVNGSPRLVIRLAMHYTKRYLGPKATKFFHIPEIIYDLSLLLSPHVFLLAILFKHRAFLSDGLNNNPDSLHKLQIYPGAKQLRLALKPEIEEKFIFRAPVKEFRGFQLSERSLPYSSMNQWIRRIGILLGFQNNTLCYSLRYMAGNNLDQSVNISDALRNLVMDHAPGSETFQKHYLNRNVVADLWAIHRSEEPQYALLQQATSHGHSKEVRRPIDLTPEQRKMAVAEDPEYQQLTKEQLSLPTGPKFAEERRKLTLARANLRMKLRNRALEKLRSDWDSAQSVDDIEQQIRGADFSALPEVQPRSCRPMGPLHQAMFDAITMPLDDKSNNLVQRKINAINALIAYCDVQEPPMITLIDSRHHAASQREAQDKGKGKGKGEGKAQDQVHDNWEEDLKKSVSAHGMGGGDNVRKCFICVALALTMSPTEPAFNKLCHDFYSKLGLQRHFTNTHLSKVKENDETECPFCKITLRDKMHLQNHAEVIHGIKTPKKRGMK